MSQTLRPGRRAAASSEIRMRSAVARYQRASCEGDSFYDGYCAPSSVRVGTRNCSALLLRVLMDLRLNVPSEPRFTGEDA